MRAGGEMALLHGQGRKTMWGRLAACGGLVTVGNPPGAPVSNRRAGCHPAPQAFIKVSRAGRPSTTGQEARRPVLLCQEVVEVALQQFVLWHWGQHLALALIRDDH